MMPAMDQAEYPVYLKEIFPRAGAALLRLLHGAAENAYFLRTDFFTIRDWTELADHQGDEALHALLLLLMVALEEGSLCIELADASLRARLGDLVPETEAAEWSRRILASVDSPATTRLVGASVEDQRPVIAFAAHGRRFLYFQKHLQAELEFGRELNQRLERTGNRSSVDWTAILDEVVRTQPLTLDPDQRNAVQSALSKNLTIISGGPGTGKTSIVLTVLRCLLRGGVDPERIALAAPTGRAAQRLTDAMRAGLDRFGVASPPLPAVLRGERAGGKGDNADCKNSSILQGPVPSPPARLPLNTEGEEGANCDARLRELAGTTLHRLLGYRPHSNLFSRHRENPIPADVVIVDEVSMVGLVLMSQLLDAVGPSTKLILLGDKDQLPSVEAGAVLAHLVPDEGAAHASLRDHVVVLKTNHRSEKAIRVAADAINRQDVSMVDALPRMELSGETTLDGQSGCFLLEQKQRTANELRGFLQRWVDQAYFHARQGDRSLAELVESGDDAELPRVFSLMDRFRLLTLVRESAWGCDEINAFLDSYLRPRLDADGRGGLFAGAPVLITANDANRGLYNGDVGIALRRPSGGLRVAFPRYEKPALFPAESLPAHQLGFALTVHKSQGSEYANMMLVLPPKGAKRLLTKELIYTAVTRAKSSAIICAAPDVLRQAVGRRIERESGVLSEPNEPEA